MEKPYTSKNLTLGDEMANVMWSLMGKLVPQLPGVINFAYDLCFRHVIARWKGIIEEIHFGGSIIHLGPQNGPGSKNC